MTVLFLAPGITWGENPKDKCRIGRKCGWETPYATYGKTISDYNYLRKLFAEGGASAKRDYGVFVKSGKGGEAEESQSEIEILSEMKWSLGYWEPMCKFRFKGGSQTWWAGVSSIRCPSTVKETKKGELPIKQEVVQADTCFHDLQCWGDKHHGAATRKCIPLVENQARYAHRWTDGWLKAKFDRVMWKDKKNGIVAYRTQKVEFQNGFGAWVKMSSWCRYNPDTGEAEIINIVPRR